MTLCCFFAGTETGGELDIFRLVATFGLDGKIGAVEGTLLGVVGFAGALLLDAVAGAGVEGVNVKVGALKEGCEVAAGSADAALVRGSKGEEGCTGFEGMNDANGEAEGAAVEGNGALGCGKVKANCGCRGELFGAAAKEVDKVVDTLRFDSCGDNAFGCKAGAVAVG